MKAALIGEKLGHSYSKWIHEISFEKQGIAVSYDLLEISKEDLKNKNLKIKESLFFLYMMDIM